MGHSHSTIGAIILDIVYGYRVTSDRDEWVEIGERAGTNFQRSVKPGAWAVDVLPFCKHVQITMIALIDPLIVRYVPTWFPFTGWKTFALDSTERRKIQVDGAFELVKKAMVREALENWVFFVLTFHAERGHRTSEHGLALLGGK